MQWADVQENVKLQLTHWMSFQQSKLKITAAKNFASSLNVDSSKSNMIEGDSMSPSGHSCSRGELEL